MKSLESSYPVKEKTENNALYRIGLLVFIFILVFSGTFFRTPPGVEMPRLDWFVLSRLLFSLLGFLIGGFLIFRNKTKLGFSSILICLFLTAAFISAIASPYPKIVFGYAILLVGASVLTIGLVFSARNVAQLERIEKIWLFTMCFCILKDVVTSLISPPDIGYQVEIMRIGTGLTQSNQLSLYAALVFWLSFRKEIRTKLIWILRVLLIAVILGAISRMSIVAFFFGGFTYGFMKAKDNLKKITYILSCATVVIFVLLTFLFIPKLGDKVLNYAKRGQTNAEISDFTGRADIWREAIGKIPEAPLTGHGYVVTRFFLVPISNYNWYLSCHNDFLEPLFSMGILGFIPLILMYIHSLKWITRSSRLSSSFSPDLALHATSVVVMLWVKAMFEVNISGNLIPLQPLFFYYLLILDREKQFTLARQQFDSSGK